MKFRSSYIIAVALLACSILSQSHASAIPAGTTLLARTLQPISSTDAPGRRFLAQLESAVTVNKKVILPVGTKVWGKVVTSKRLTTSSQSLTVNLTEVQLGDRAVPLKTTGSQPLDNNFKSRRGISVSRHSYVVAAGRKMEFRLAEPLNL